MITTTSAPCFAGKGLRTRVAHVGRLGRLGRRARRRVAISLAIPVAVAIAVATPAAIPMVSMPVASATTKLPGCGLVPPSLVSKIYRAPFGAPEAQTEGPVQVCFFFATAPVISVIVRFQVGESLVTFNAGRKQFDARGEHTVTRTGFGRAAYSVVLGSGAALTGTIAVLTGSTELLVSGTGALAKCEALADKVLPKL
jgi:hypothetical protein